MRVTFVDLVVGVRNLKNCSLSEAKDAVNEFLGTSVSTDRPLIAALAMQGMLGHPECPTWNVAVAEDAVKAADALLAELEKPKT